ncbi:MAG: FAD-binding oxidoreductase [Boseongicola sp.]|nr:FAD-binding oxidoreductase [Boseongicola sp.]
MVDVTVRGAGIFGLAIAWKALQRGARVRVIDRNGPGSGASGGIVGALQPHAPDPWNPLKQYQLESLTEAREFWEGVDATSGASSGFARVGRLQPLMRERDIALARERAAAARKNWDESALWEIVDARGAGNWVPPSPTGLLVHDTLSAIVHPRDAIRSLAAAILAGGGEIVADEPDQGPVIWATGWQGLLDLGNALDRPVGSGIKGQAALIRHDAVGQPQVFADGLHFVPHLDGTLAIGSTSERDFATPTTTDGLLDDIIRRAGEIMPDLAGAAVVERWAGVRPRSISRAPLLGPWPGRAGQHVANGGFKIGFGVAPKVAGTILDLVLDGVDTIPPEFHTRRLTESPDRAFAPNVGFGPREAGEDQAR